MIGMDDFSNIVITLLQLNKYDAGWGFNITLLSITVGESERCLFSCWKEFYDTEMDILFFHFKF